MIEDSQLLGIHSRLQDSSLDSLGFKIVNRIAQPLLTRNGKREKVLYLSERKARHSKAEHSKAMQSKAMRSKMLLNRDQVYVYRRKVEIYNQLVKSSHCRLFSLSTCVSRSVAIWAEDFIVFIIFSVVQKITGRESSNDNVSTSAWRSSGDLTKQGFLRACS